MTAELPALSPTLSFEQACTAVLAYLGAEVPLGHWSVTRFDGEDQVTLTVNGDAYDMPPGRRQAWADTLCSLVVDGKTPMVAPDAMAIDAYRNAPAAQHLQIGAFVGIPILRPDGSAFGTLCGVDPHTQPPDLAGKEPLLRLLSLLLGTVLAADMARTDLTRQLNAAELASETDSLTGLCNRRGWDRYLALEQDRCHRYGDPAGIVVLDIDGLKTINDTHGHHAGDRLLRQTADTIKHVTRAHDIAARLGGDEFGVLLIGATRSNIDTFTHRLTATLDRAGLKASVGSSSNTRPGRLHNTWQAADQAMYNNKRQRNN